MKKFLIAILFLNTIPAFSLCSLDSAEVCSLPTFREQVSPTYNPKSNVDEFSGTPEARLNPINRADIDQNLRRFTPGEADHSYNSGCQFGVCLQNTTTPLFQQPKQ